MDQDSVFFQFRIEKLQTTLQIDILKSIDGHLGEFLKQPLTVNEEDQALSWLNRQVEIALWTTPTTSLSSRAQTASARQSCLTALETFIRYFVQKRDVDLARVLHKRLQLLRQKLVLSFSHFRNKYINIHFAPRCFVFLCFNLTLKMV